jgi:hypothetical protein
MGLVSRMDGYSVEIGCELTFLPAGNSGAAFRGNVELLLINLPHSHSVLKEKTCIKRQRLFGSFIYFFIALREDIHLNNILQFDFCHSEETLLLHSTNE